MGALDYAIDRITRTIPREVLDYAYIDRYDWRNRYPSTVEEILRREVLLPRCVEDMENFGGLQMIIPLDDQGIEIEEVTINSYVFRVPLAATQGRFITSALSVISGSVNNYGINYNGTWGAFNQAQLQRQQCGWNPMSDSLQRGMNVFAPMNVLSTANISLIGNNTIMISNVTPVQFPLSLRCFVGHDPELSNLQRNVWNDFYKLCYLAVQSDIYNRCVIRLDRGQTAGGQELGSFREAIEKYSASEESYQEFLMGTWRGVAAWNDPMTKSRAIRLQSGYN